VSAGATRELQAAIEALAAEMAPALVADARAEAEARARAILSKEITQALLNESEALVPPRRAVQAQSPAPEEPERTRPPARDASEVGLYLYGIVRANMRITGALPGVAAECPVFLLEGNELAAIVSSVPLDEFGEEQLRENLNDVTWLEEKARAHEAVLEALLESSTVVPTRLCTIFRDEKHVREMMGREGAALVEALERLEGKSEWGAKAFAEAGALDRAAAERAQEQSGEQALSPGAAYMDRRRKEARAREEAEEIADGWAQQIHEYLAREAAEALLNPLQRREVSGHEGDMLLNGVYLVANENVDRFRELIVELGEDYRGRGVSIQLTGPWPAYNFVKSSIESAR
jgi:hypothetical protein